MSVPVSSAVSAVKAMLDSNQWRYDFDENKLMFSLGFNLSKTKLSSVDIKIRILKSHADPSRARLIISHGYIPLSGDEESMQNVGEYLTRANYGLNIGNFEFDYNDGEIRYKVALACIDELPSLDSLEDLCGTPVSMFNRYGRGLLAVNDGTMTAEAAAQQADAK